MAEKASDCVDRIVHLVPMALDGGKYDVLSVRIAADIRRLV